MCEQQQTNLVETAKGVGIIHEGQSVSVGRDNAQETCDDGELAQG